jgi:hypothetical protein|tara:strand:+ start:1230 stop:1394 length:165 start_codon:yes stop_codon:yes gene_type:complete
MKYMNQQPAGKELKTKQKPLGTRVMVSNNATIMPTLKKIDNIEYKGNAVLNANK